MHSRFVYDGFDAKCAVKIIELSDKILYLNAAIIRRVFIYYIVTKCDELYRYEKVGQSGCFSSIDLQMLRVV